MIYLERTTDAQSVSIPRPGTGGLLGGMLALRSNINLTEWRFTATDSGDRGGSWTLSLQLTETQAKDMPAGEYTYTLTDADDAVLCRGLLVMARKYSYTTKSYECRLRYEQQ